ncbi:MAG: tRNA pseudouridine(38-40) synthase TruA [Candidatus Aminicenantes bacterium]|nr:tRNA pseudouridine(38-40) synthase TruA [Candidatus Aminicenantes bacterium]
MLQNYLISITYDGTDYFGWQRQKEDRTIQGQIEKALNNIFGVKTNIIGAGRTDAGVHARGQTANFKAPVKYDPKELLNALNGNLPKDIRILSVKKVSPEFHARKSARTKVYEYRIFNRPKIDPFVLRYVFHIPSPLLIDRMQEGASLFIREADFTSFSSNRELNPIRRVIRSEIRKKGDEIIYLVEANGFLRYMVRTMTGALIQIGKGKIPPQSIEDILLQKSRSKDAPTAPPQGLCLIKVNY